MKRLIYILGILFLATGCVTQQKCQRKFPPQVITRDSIIVQKVNVPVYVHDTIYVKGDTIHDTTMTYVKNGLVESRVVAIQTLLCKASSRVLHSRLKLSLVQKDTLLTNVIHDSIAAYVKTHHLTTTVIKTKVIYKTHWYDKAARNIAGGVLIIAFVFVMIKYGKSIFKFILKLFV